MDLQGLAVEIPLIVPFTPEGWSLPSIVSMCISAANIMPALVIILRWRQGKTIFGDSLHLYDYYCWNYCWLCASLILEPNGILVWPRAKHVAIQFHFYSINARLYIVSCFL